MKLSLQKSELLDYVKKQVDSIFPDGHSLCGNDIASAYEMALERTEFCFKHIVLPGYHDCDGAVLSHLHSDQYATFLYYFANSLWRISGNGMLCSKLMYLNRVLHGFFVSYKCRLPDIFALQHPIGSVIGNADYHNFLVILQNVTINTGVSGDSAPCPYLGEGLFCGAGAKILGNKPIGKRVSVGVDAVVMDIPIPDDSVVIKNVTSGSMEVRARKKPECAAQIYFNVPVT